ncbi:hypothetical protein AMATHDRAFT_2617 [Amanita thiersii Skay4041]|uniref:BTB domain-containing protein n=1 Tax=Amanita thiersii Skay4041 TaxID=703135 RepID=A0A2A9NP79_9AGAR|nr:hypothetical protein AMATHDRAFT_2617 [Amanita thiersii Skay4041]
MSSPLVTRFKHLSTSSLAHQSPLPARTSPLVLDRETGVLLKRHNDMWFDDGSVICRAEDTLFRVHISQLARHSVYFRDMFAAPQPPSSNAANTRYEELRGLGVNIDTTPIIYLHDSAEDVGNLFTALYDGPTLGDNGKQDFRRVEGILRLSNKYIIDSLKAKALAHLSKAWPLSLKAWDTREDIARTHELETNHRFYPNPIAVINIARETDAPSLLPSAFYDLARHSYTQIFEPSEDDFLYQPPSSVQSLSSADMQRLCLAKETIQHAITSLIQAMGNSQYLRHAQYHSVQAHSRRVSITTGVCLSAATCRKDFSELVDLATQHYLFDRERGCLDPLYVAEELGQLKSTEFSECIACARSLETWAARERERMWKLIPLWFRLEHPTALESTSTG